MTTQKSSMDMDWQQQDVLDFKKKCVARHLGTVKIGDRGKVRKWLLKPHTTKDLLSAVEMSIHRDQLGVLDYLLEQGTFSSPEQRVLLKKKCLANAIRAKKEEMCIFLMQDPELEGGLGSERLFWENIGGSATPRLLDFIREHGPDIRTRFAVSELFMGAISHHNETVVRWLIKKELHFFLQTSPRDGSLEKLLIASIGKGQIVHQILPLRERWGVKSLKKALIRLLQEAPMDVRGAKSLLDRGAPIDPIVELGNEKMLELKSGWERDQLEESFRGNLVTSQKSRL